MDICRKTCLLRARTVLAASAEGENQITAPKSAYKIIKEVALFVDIFTRLDTHPDSC